jgi:hypothetical protein
MCSGWGSRYMICHDMMWTCARDGAVGTWYVMIWCEHVLGMGQSVHDMSWYDMLQWCILIHTFGCIITKTREVTRLKFQMRRMASILSIRFKYSHETSCVINGYEWLKWLRSLTSDHQPNTYMYCSAIPTWSAKDFIYLLTIGVTGQFILNICDTHRKC